MEGLGVRNRDGGYGGFKGQSFVLDNNFVI
jgi:hypothetical protein